MVEGLGQEGGGRLSGHVKDNSASSLDGAASVLEIEINKSLKFTSSLVPWDSWVCAGAEGPPRAG